MLIAVVSHPAFDGWTASVRMCYSSREVAIDGSVMLPQDTYLRSRVAALAAGPIASRFDEDCF